MIHTTKNHTLWLPIQDHTFWLPIQDHTLCLPIQEPHSLAPHPGSLSLAPHPHYPVFLFTQFTYMQQDVGVSSVELALCLALHWKNLQFLQKQEIQALRPGTTGRWGHGYTYLNAPYFQAQVLPSSYKKPRPPSCNNRSDTNKTKLQKKKRAVERRRSTPFKKLTHAHAQ